MNFLFRAYVTSSVALVGASVIVATPVTAPPPDVYVPDIQLAAGEESITLDLVRHATNISNGPAAASDAGSSLPAAGQGSEGVSGGPPGAPLTELGWEQARSVAQTIHAEYGDSIAGIYGGEEIRMWQTADPLADLLHMDVQQLLGLNEIDGGLYAGNALSSPGGILFLLTLAAWAFGLDFVQMPGSPDFNGVVFEDTFNNAVQTIYDNTVSSGGPSTDVAVSGEAAITAWALMNANNPDISVFLPIFYNELIGKATFLPNVGQVVLEGSPGDWTLVSFNGTPVPPPDLLTSLFVDLRDLITAPQSAAWHVWEAVLGGDPTTIGNAIQTGLSEVGTEIVRFPQAVITDILDAFGDGTGAGQAAGESLGDALASLI